MRHEFTLREQFLLLGLNDEKGKAEHSDYGKLRSGLGGAVLMELAMLSRLGTREGSVLVHNQPRLTVVDRSPTGDVVLDRALEKIAGSKKDRRSFAWVSKFEHKLGNLVRETADPLVELGVLSRQKRKRLLFTSIRYPVIDSEPESELRQRVVALIGSIGAAPQEATFDGPTLALLLLLNETGYVHIFAGRDREKALHRWLKVSKDGIDRVLPAGPMLYAIAEGVKAAIAAQNTSAAGV